MINLVFMYINRAITMHPLEAGEMYNMSLRSVGGAGVTGRVLSSIPSAAGGAGGVFSDTAV